MPGAASERVLPIAHEQFDRAEPLNEVYRILRLHAQSVGMPERPDPELACTAEALSPLERERSAQ